MSKKNNMACDSIGEWENMEYIPDLICNLANLL
jgi:hypothetical protein